MEAFFGNNVSDLTQKEMLSNINQSMKSFASVFENDQKNMIRFKEDH